MSKKPVVVVAMSGGVDSSMAAALLVEQGYSVIGVMLRLWSEQGSEETNRCCTPDAMAMARRVAAKLSIPFYALDAQQFFYDTVVHNFIEGYTHNLTPNPCVLCNRIVRWDFLLTRALSLGADYLATGHYARLVHTPDDRIQLWRGVDLTKDQSYVLHVLTQKQLKHALFPLGGYNKTEVRQLAHKFDLPVAERPDSQDLCFVGGGDYSSFLMRHAPQAQMPGQIVDQSGNVLGQHQGLAFYTIGQRKGLLISSPNPLYVLEKDPAHNSLIVGTADQLGSNILFADQVNWIDGDIPASPFTANVKIRYKSYEILGLVTPMQGNVMRIEFEHPVRDITPGQAAVLYNGDICLGGGIISPKIS
jgi:tRNA-specific 2-thiouridylase